MKPIIPTVRTVIGGKYHVEIPLRFGKYNYICNLGAGAFSVVIMVSDRETGDRYACKVCSRKLFSDDNLSERFERETRIMQRMKHPNVVCLHEIVYTTDLIMFITELCSNGELFTMIMERGRLDEWTAMNMFRGIVDGMIYIHQRGIVHRDLKPENILLDAHFNPKIGDFGLCFQISNENERLSTPCGSRYYVSPEVMCADSYDGKKSDIWSLGVVLFVMTTGKFPWADMSLENIRNSKLDIPHYLSNELHDLLKKMVNQDPDSRISIEDVRRHVWVTQKEPHPSDITASRMLPKMFPKYNDAGQADPWGKRVPIIRPCVEACDSNKQSHPIKMQQLIRRPVVTSKRRSIPVTSSTAICTSSPIPQTNYVSPSAPPVLLRAPLDRRRSQAVTESEKRQLPK